VIGYGFHSETLCAVFPIEEEKARVDKHLDFLISLDFLLATPKAKYYAFRHEVIQQVRKREKKKKERKRKRKDFSKYED
jgi:predicted ATPase